MPTTAELQGRVFKRGEKVRLVDDIAGYPAGSTGKVAVANGVTWKRYWVRFADGSATGHIDHHSLVRTEDYEPFLTARDRELIEAEESAARAAEEAASAPAAAADGGGTTAGGVVVNGVTIPQRLLDMSAAARVRLGA